MKRIRVLTVLALVIALIAACGGKSNPSENESSGRESAPGGPSDASGFPSPAQITTPEMVRNMDVFSKWDVKDTVDKEFCTEIVFSDGGAAVTGKGAAADGAFVTIDKEGDYYITGTTSDGQICVNADPLAKIRLIFAGVDITCQSSACVLVRMADKVCITLADGTVNRFADAGKAYQAKDGVYGVDAVLFAKEDITVNGSGKMVVEAGFAHGICTKDDLVIFGGTIEVTAKDKGIVGEDSVRIRNCDLTVTAGDDAVHTKTDYKEGKGFIYLESGTVTLTSGDDAMHAATALLIDGGSLTVKESKEGLEAATVVIGGGTVALTAKDDGVNAAYLLGEEEPLDAAGEGDPHVQKDAYIRIEGGEIAVNADGDGLDTNGTMFIKGGTVTVDGPAKKGNAALDSGCGIHIDGGTVFAAGDAAEAEAVREDSKQRFLQCTFSSPMAEGDEIRIEGPDGTVLYEGTAAKAYSHITFSAEEMKKGTYSVTAGTQSGTAEAR
ncbi:MAG: carbohydrate-binding domain-containing protein [Lachnospiraceae bacterium]|nr:carbohydrate-binding domain-containing protein [Lachnospiraceae bacterium]